MANRSNSPINVRTLGCLRLGGRICSSSLDFGFWILELHDSKIQNPKFLRISGSLIHNLGYLRSHGAIIRLESAVPVAGDNVVLESCLYKAVENIVGCYVAEMPGGRTIYAPTHRYYDYLAQLTPA